MTRFIPPGHNGRKILFTFLSLALAVSAQAVTSYYWDINGTLSGAGGSGSPSGSWEGTNWADNSSSGTNVTGNWVEGNFPRFCAGSDATGTYTITASSSHTITGMFNRTAGNTIVSGPGTMYLFVLCGPCRISGC